MKPLGHKKLDASLTALHNALGAAGAATGGEAIDRCFDALVDDLQLVVREHAGMADELLRAYEQLGIVFEITRKLPTIHTEEEVVRLFVDSLRITYHDRHIVIVRRAGKKRLTMDPEPESDRDEIAAAVNACIGTGRIQVSSVESNPNVAELMCAPVFAGEELFCVITFVRSHAAQEFQASDMSLVEALTLFCGDLLRNYHLTHELQRLSVDMVRALVGAIDQKDEYTSGHSNRVGYYARLLGSELGLDDEALQMLEWAALLHDVGKIGIRDDVLKKRGKLTDEEFEHIKEHPVRSHEVVRRVPQLRGALDGVRHHHERYDGRGYPDGLAGENIPLQARIVLVADIYDALTTSRSYRTAFSIEKALAILREEAGTVGDPTLVNIFESIIRRELERGTLPFQCGAPGNGGVKLGVQIGPSEKRESAT